MIKLKPGVSLKGLKTEMHVGLGIVNSVYQEMGYHTIVTSCNDGKHSRGSLHYVGLAIDFRTRHMKDQAEKDKLTDQAAEALGQEFDAVLESDHLHVEYQPKIG